MAHDSIISWSGVADLMNGLGAALDGGFARIYDNTGAVPVWPDDSNGSNVLLAECPLNADAFAAIDAGDLGVLTANPVTADASAAATGTPSYARLYASDGTTCKWQGLTGLADADCVIETESGAYTITAGEQVTITSLILRGPRK